MPLSDLNRDALQTELSRLLNQQIEAMEQSVYVGMNAGDKNEYDNRASRITHILSMLGIAPSPHRHRPDL